MRYSSPIGPIALIAALLTVAACAVMSLIGLLTPPLAAASVLPLFLVIGVGVASPASGVFARCVLGVNSDRHELALTFDDGPDPLWTPLILDLLERRQQRATFFVIGERAEQHPELLRDIVKRGHEVANHSWSHSYLTAFTPPDSLARQLERTNSLIVNVTGIRPRWFRPPVGLLSPRISRAARIAGLQLVSWTATARDGVERTTVAEALGRLERAVAPGAILVLHDGRMKDSAEPVEPIARMVVSALLDRMEAKRLRSVTLSQLCEIRGVCATCQYGNNSANQCACNQTQRNPANGPRQSDLLRQH